MSVAKRALVYDRRGTRHDHTACAAIQLLNRHLRIGRKSRRLEFGHQLMFRQEALRLTRKLREHKGLARDRFGLIRQGVPREREDKEIGVNGRDPRCLGHGPPKLRRRAREIPDAMRHDQFECAIPCRDRIHRRADNSHA